MFSKANICDLLSGLKLFFNLHGPCKAFSWLVIQLWHAMHCALITGCMNVMKMLLNFKGCKKYMIIIIILHYNFTGQLSSWGPQPGCEPGKVPPPPPPTSSNVKEVRLENLHHISRKFKERLKQNQKNLKVPV